MIRCKRYPYAGVHIPLAQSRRVRGVDRKEISWILGSPRPMF